MAGGRVEFTKYDDAQLAKYLAVHCPDGRNRSGNSLWQALVDDADGLWPWATRHPWQSWRERYVKNTAAFQKRIVRYQKNHGIDPNINPPPTSGTPGRSQRTRFSSEDDRKLLLYLIEHSLSPDTRLSTTLYKNMCDSEDEWVDRHPWSSWRERYKNNKEEYDKHILHAQKKYGVKKAKHVSPKKSTKPGRKTKKRSPTPEEQSEAEERPPPLKYEEEEESTLQDAAEEGGGGPLVDQEHEDIKSEGKGKQRESRDAREKRGPAAPAEDDRPHKRRRVDHDADVGKQSAESVDLDHAHQPEPAGGAGSRNGTEPGSREDDSGVVAGEDPQEGPAFDDQKDALAGNASEEDEEAAQLLGGANPEDNEEQSQTADEEGHTLAPVDGAAEQSRGSSTSIPETEQTPTRCISPDVPSSPVPAIASSLPGAFPVTSIPSVQAHPKQKQVPSQIISPLRTPTHNDRKLDTKISQEPTPPTSVAPQSPAPADPEDPAKVQSSPAVEDEGPSTATTSSRTRRSRTSKLLVRREGDADFFASVPPTPTPASSRHDSPVAPMRRRAPPRLEEGAFNSVFTDARGKPRATLGKPGRATGVDDEDMYASDSQQSQDEWPPNRTRYKDGAAPAPPTVAVQAATLKRERHSDDPVAAQKESGAMPLTPCAAPAPASNGGHHAFSQLAVPAKTPAPRLRPRQQDEEHHHDFSQPSIAVPSMLDRLSSLFGAASRTEPVHVARTLVPPSKLAVLNKVLNKGRVPSYPPGRTEEQVPQAMNVVPDVTSRLPSLPIRDPEHAAQDRTSSYSLPQASSSTSVRSRSGGPSPTPHEPGISQPSYVDDSAAEVSDSGLSYLSDAEGSTTKGGKAKGRQPAFLLDEHRGQFLFGNHYDADGYHPQAESTLHARQSLPPFLNVSDDTADDLVVRRSRSDGALDHADVPYSVGDDPPITADESVILRRVALEGMSRNHGFNVEVVSRLWRETKSLHDTDKILAEMREAANRAAHELLEGYRAEAHMRAARERPSGHAQGRRSSVRPTRYHRRVSNSHTSHSRNSSVFRFVPLPPGNAANDAVVEYSPPKYTRAGQYNRLAKEGRREEAFAREISRVTGRGSPSVSPLKPSASDGVDDGSHEQVEMLLGEGEEDADMEEHAPQAEPPHVISRTMLHQLEQQNGQHSVRVLTGELLGEYLARTGR